MKWLRRWLWQRRTIVLSTQDLNELRTGRSSLKRNGQWIYWD